MTIREGKGKSIIGFPDNYTIIDLETTGLSPLRDCIIEVSAVKVRNGVIADTFSSLVNSDDTVLSSFIISLTGIKEDMLAAAPDISKVIPEYLRFIGDDVVVGHNVGFDVNFLYEAARSYTGKIFSNDYINTLRMSRKLYPDLESHGLSELAAFFSIDNSGAHRAEADCLLTYSIYNIFKDEVTERYSSVDAFVQAFKKKVYRSSSVKSSDIVPSTDLFDETHPLFNKVCVFTGTLEKMRRRDAMQIVADVGGINGDTITKKTNFLILGNNDYCSTIKDGKSSKQKKAESYKLKGCDIEIIPENVFYDMISDN